MCFYFCYLDDILNASSADFALSDFMNELKDFARAKREIEETTAISKFLNYLKDENREEIKWKRNYKLLASFIRYLDSRPPSKSSAYHGKRETDEENIKSEEKKSHDVKKKNYNILSKFLKHLDNDFLSYSSAFNGKNKFEDKNFAKREEYLGKYFDLIDKYASRYEEKPYSNMDMDEKVEIQEDDQSGVSAGYHEKSVINNDKKRETEEIKNGQDKKDEKTKVNKRKKDTSFDKTAGKTSSMQKTSDELEKRERIENKSPENAEGTFNDRKDGADKASIGNLHDERISSGDNDSTDSKKEILEILKKLNTALERRLKKQIPAS